MAEIVLTPEQRAVVEHRGGALLVSAAAGSGKTKVLIDRVLRFVQEDGHNVDDFLMITFTQAAAAELRGKLIARLSELLGDDPDNRHLQKQLGRVYLAHISTVHAFCGELLREYAHLLGLPADFRVCDEQEAAALRERVMKNLLEQAYQSPDEVAEIRAALDMLGAGRDDRALPELIYKVDAQAHCWRDAEQRMEQWKQSLALSDCEDVGQTVWGDYLLREFRVYLNGCKRRLENDCAMIAECESLAAYLPTFSDNIAWLERLSAARTWDELRAVPDGAGKLKAVRSCAEPELQLRVKSDREQVIKGVRKWCGRVSPASEEALDDLRLSGTALYGLLLLTERYSELYGAEKRRRHVLDYNDLEHETLRLLYDRSGSPTAAASEIGSRFAEIMIDEYQDTNAVQDSIFRAISRKGENLFFVGDVKQSIYRFRLADPTIFLDKYRTFADYKQAVPGGPCKILLSDNFRSDRQILAAANDVFRLTMTPRVGGLYYGDAEALHPKREFPPTQEPAVELLCSDLSGLPERPPVRNEEVDAEIVAERIARLLRDGTIPDGDGLRPVCPEDIVILLRSVSGRSAYYISALQRRGIRCISGNDDLFASEEIGFLIDLLYLIDNPHQDIPLLSVLMSPVFRFSADDMAFIRAENRGTDLFDALNASMRGKKFLTILSALRRTAQRGSLRELLDETERRTYLRAIYGCMEGGEQRMHNLDALFALADGYETGDRYGLPGFLRYLDGLKEKGMKTEPGKTVGAVRIISIHKSKGLEFPVVFLANLSKQFNFSDATQSVLVDPELGIGASVTDPEKQIRYPTVARAAISERMARETVSEEMRVLYVAMTRAQHRLIMTYCSRSLKRRLQSIAKDLTLPASDALIESAAALGDWVLMAAMTHTEAGELFELGGYPEQRGVSEYPWTIRVTEPIVPVRKAPIVRQAEPAAGPLRPFRKPEYLHGAAAEAPGKLTATQLKGRGLDREISEEAPSAPPFRFVKPRLLDGARPLTPAERGTAIHLAMQFLRYERCTDLSSIEAELRRLTRERFLTPQQAEAVPPAKLLNFFQSPVGRRVLCSERVVREFKFSVLEDAARYDPALEGERVLLQGVTDCCILDPDGLTILDFKSDAVKTDGERERAEYYRGQLDAYSRALSKIFARPVKKRILWFFATDTAVEL